MEVIPEETHDGNDVVMGPPPLPWQNQQTSPKRRILKARRSVYDGRPSGESPSGSTTPKRTPPKQQRMEQAAENQPQNPEMLPKEGNSTQMRKVMIYFNKLEFVRVLGEGAFGEVVLMVDREDPTIALAVKKIDITKITDKERDMLKREALIQRACRGHVNILKYYNMQARENVFELYLEYADGGELFDQIEPDNGMEPPKAQYYFRQLMSGIEYIHSKGVVHRDIKPENLLVTKRHVLKICDFGLATVFLNNGKERLLNTPCGTLCYAAPEVFMDMQYRGPPVDVWSSGLVLLAMLVGEIPWDRPKRDSENFVAFIQNNDYARRPWCRLDTNELSIIKLMLTYNPNKRANVLRIMKHPWFVADLLHQSSKQRKIPTDSSTPSNRVRVRNGQSTSASQPSTMRHMATPTSGDSQFLTLDPSPKPVRSNIVSFSQPVNVDSLLLNRSQLSSSQVASQLAHPHATLVRRMTRFCVTVDAESALQAVENAANMLDCQCHCSTSHQLYLTCLTSEDLSFVATVYEMIDDGHHKVLIDFRRSRGDGLDFKRRFLEFKEALSPIISRDSLDWLEKKGFICTRKMETIIAESGDATGEPVDADNDSMMNDSATRRHTDQEMQS